MLWKYRSFFLQPFCPPSPARLAGPSMSPGPSDSGGARARSSVVDFWLCTAGLLREEAFVRVGSWNVRSCWRSGCLVTTPSSSALSSAMGAPPVSLRRSESRKVYEAPARDESGRRGCNLGLRSPDCCRESDSARSRAPFGRHMSASQCLYELRSTGTWRRRIGRRTILPETPLTEDPKTDSTTAAITEWSHP